VPGWERLYEVSDLGRVRSLPRQTARGVRGGKVLTPWDGSRGYPFVTLTEGARKLKVAIHVLVLTVHGPGPRPPGEEARHGPGGKHDNRLANLCWGTRAENIADRRRDGQDNRGERHPQVKLTWKAVREIRDRVAAGQRQTDLAAEHGVSRSAVNQAVLGRTWQEG
jgi:hypothetical protein